MGLFCEVRKVKGREGGARGQRKGGATGKREVAASPPYRLSLPETVHFFTLGDKVLWVLMLRVKGHGSRGITGWFITRVRVRAHYICDHFFKKLVFRPDGRGLKGGAWRKAQKTEERLRLKRAGIMALFIFGIKRAGKKDGLLSKK